MSGNRFTGRITKAQTEGESPFEHKYVLSGRWVDIKSFDEKITRRDLERGGLKGIIGANPDPGLY